MGRIDTITPPSPRINIDPQRRAWGIMLISFAVFCTICLVTGIGIIYFLFQSSVPLNGTMEVARGSGGITGQEPIRLNASVSNNDGLSTDPLSQATITLSDPENGKQIVVAMTLRGDTSLKLIRGTRPRFTWSSGQYIVELQDFRGELNVYIPKRLSRELNVSILTRAGDLIYLRSGGQYILRASDARVQVINQSGDLILKPSNVDIGKSIPANNQGIISYADDPNDVAISPANTNLVGDTVFADDLQPLSGTDQGGQPFIKDWVCNDNSNPNGKAYSTMSDGRPVLRFLRDDNATSHGETGCVRSWPRDGQNVESFNYLSLRATFKINYQSLSACGQDGSECPLMLIVEYRDKNDVNRRWIHGFYYFIDPNRNFPLQCNSCLQAHEQINEKTWFTYDSGNLLNLIANPDQLAEQRPVSIIDIQFKSSGHQYDVMIGDVALFADLNANP
ncbi:MAG: hypothetical protein GC179_18120 [Anaerolineaceae bacterium]|nr:hypothetical protein [Anaerolineaceae bacterium]